MSTWVTLAQAKGHLRITASDGDTDLQLKLDAAEAVVMEYVKYADVTGHLPIVRAAVLIQLGELYQFRGDDDAAGPGLEDGGLSPAVTRLLRPLRDPTLA